MSRLIDDGYDYGEIVEVESVDSFEDCKLYYVTVKREREPQEYEDPTTTIRRRLEGKP